VREQAELAWLLAAAIAVFTSINLFARLQENLLRAYGVTIPHCRAVALSYSRTAIAFTMPAGSVVSTVYAYRQYRAYGADRGSAMIVLVVAGAMSAASLLGLGAVGIVGGELAGQQSPAWIPAAPWIAVCAAVVAIAVLARCLVVKSVPIRYWAPGLAAAVANWLTDLLSFYFATRAFGMTVSLAAVSTLYLISQLIRQVPLTPGGFGVIEATLLTGLIVQGAAPAPAAAAVLAYRFLSFWLVLPIGLTSWILLRRPSRRRAAVTVTDPATQVPASRRRPAHLPARPPS
jgi:uncharacterized membrane protein YbhN (UPF0104 family)